MKMKKITFISLLLLSVFGFAQNLEPVQDKIDYEEDIFDCWKVSITPETYDVKKAFRSYIKDKYSIRMKGIGMFSNKDVLYAEDVVIDKISSKRVNFYASIIDIDGVSEIKVFGGYGYALSFNNDKLKEEFTAIRSILVGFLNSYLPDYYKEKVKDANKRYADYVEKDEDLNNEIKSNKEKIEKLQQENTELSKDIEENQKEIKEFKEHLIRTEEEAKYIKAKLNMIKR